jgi:hypothetical protein
MFATGALGPVHYAGQLHPRAPRRGGPEGAVRRQPPRRRGPRDLAGRAARSACPRRRSSASCPMGGAGADHAADRGEPAEGAGGMAPVCGRSRRAAHGRRGPDRGRARAGHRALRAAARAEGAARQALRGAAGGARRTTSSTGRTSLHRCVELLNDTTALEKAYRRRRMRSGSPGIAGGLARGGRSCCRSRRGGRSCGRAWWPCSTKPDVCAVMDLSESDIDRVSSDLRASAPGRAARSARPSAPRR